MKRLTGQMPGLVRTSALSLLSLVLLSPLALAKGHGGGGGHGGGHHSSGGHGHHVSHGYYHSTRTVHGWTYHRMYQSGYNGYYYR